MSEIFVISDHHFGHAATFEKFKLPDGSQLRKFTSVEEMNEHMIAAHNSVVKPGDKVYFLGDVTMKKSHLPIVGRLNGKKKLIMGNHDIFSAELYLKYFYDVCAYRIFPADKLILSHIPVHSTQLDRWKGNVHGHLHADSLPDPRYLCACVEQPEINYVPMPLYRVKEILNNA